jgi:hypothetical protein
MDNIARQRGMFYLQDKEKFEIGSGALDAVNTLTEPNLQQPSQVPAYLLGRLSDATLSVGRV